MQWWGLSWHCCLKRYIVRHRCVALCQSDSHAAQPMHAFVWYREAPCSPAMAPATNPFPLLSSTVGSEPCSSSLNASYEAKLTACRAAGMRLIHQPRVPPVIKMM